MKCLALALTLLASTAAVAAEEAPVPRIIVSGNGSVSTPPDRAMIGYALHGEGTTSDEAVAALVAKRKAIEGGIGALAGANQPRAGQLAVNAVRGRECNRYEAAKLSNGECTILGYSADVEMTIGIANVKDAGTLVGLIGRLGGQNPHVDRFYLADDGPAKARALAAAIATAKAQAEAIAAGAHVTLGRILTLSDGSYGGQQEMEDIVVTGARIAAPPPPPPPPPPIAVSLTPRPIETQARVQVVFAIGN